ncbi:MAG TPA: hypothetical protein VFX76_17405 [Roseiflexaceae bacterium]|nr:hypothetical protein [Roseiflexaceae bacterium]
MEGERRHYRSYLLRLWGAQSGEGFVWRASLEDARTGERHSFAELEQLFAFLRQQANDDGQISHPLRSK